MHYFIDGYNMMFRVLHAGEDLQIQREKIIQDLSTKIKVLQINATLVFDAQHQIKEITRQHNFQLPIIFTSHGQTADEYIISELKRSETPKQEIVITSDKKLAWYARTRLAKTQTVEDFLQEINKRYKNRILRNKQEKMASFEGLKLSPLLKREPPQSRKPEKIVAEYKNPEDCFDFYLDKFEKAYEELSHESPLPIKEIPKKIQKKKKPNLKDDLKHHSNIDRWESIFEKKLEKQEENKDLE